MKVVLLKQHSPNAGRLSDLLGSSFNVEGRQKLPSDCDADVLVTTHLDELQASGTKAGLVQVPGAGHEGIAWASLPAGCLGANVFCHEIPIAEYVLHAALGHVLRDHGSLELTSMTWARAYFGRPLRGEICGKVMTIVGTGHIGQEIAKRATAFGMRTVGINRSGRETPFFDYVLPVSRIEEALPDADFLVLCCPLDETTRNLMDGPRLAMLPRACFLINVARGAVVEEHALYDALRYRLIAGAALDVWYAYPTSEADRVAPSTRPFHELDNVISTPHVAGWSAGLIDRRYQSIAENIRRLASGQPLLNQIWPAG